MSDLEERRRKVVELLSQCVDQKLLLGGSDRARDLARQAYRLANNSPQLPSPWPEYAAYRFAHLQLRDSEGTQKLENLEEIDRLLQQACGSSDASPPSAIRAHSGTYRLAVLHRLAWHAQTTRQQKLSREKEMREEFDRTRDAIQRLTGQSAAEAAEQREPVIQQSLFNMLELASYFAGINYEPLEGLAALDPLRNGDWFLVGPEPEISDVSLCEEFAIAELASRGTACPKAVLFRLPDPEQGSAEWCLARNLEWREVDDTWIRLLAYTLRERPSRDTLKARVLGDGTDIPAPYLRKIIERIGDGLRALTGRAKLKVFVERSDPLQMTGDVVIWGAVHQQGFRKLRRHGS